jgi:hypothetical protein
MDYDTREIIKRLERATASGQRPDRVFDDWIVLVEACLERLPEHLASVARSGEIADDTPETVALFDRLRSQYGRYGRADYYFDLFTEAMGILVDSTALGYRDVLGDVYMAFAYPSPGAGQFFTPFPVARMMAQMTIMDGAREVHGRIQEALAQSPLGPAALLAGIGFVQDQADEAWNYFYNYILRVAAPYYRPITVSDPAVGSGVMLLAAAGQYPQWAVHLGLVQFYGQDVDMTCVRMCRINMMLYGLNGYGLHCSLATYGVGDQELMNPVPLTMEVPVWLGRGPVTADHQVRLQEA